MIDERTLQESWIEGTLVYVGDKVAIRTNRNNIKDYTSGYVTEILTSDVYDILVIDGVFFDILFIDMVTVLEKIGESNEC